MVPRKNQGKYRPFKINRKIKFVGKENIFISLSLLNLLSAGSKLRGKFIYERMFSPLLTF